MHTLLLLRCAWFLLLLAVGLWTPAIGPGHFPLAVYCHAVTFARVQFLLLVSLSLVRSHSAPISV